MSTINQAANHYFSRPNDERFWDTKELFATLLERRSRQRELLVGYGDISLTADESKGICIELSSGEKPVLNDWSFTQLCTRLDTPPISWMRRKSLTTQLNILRDGLGQVTTPTKSVPSESSNSDIWGDEYSSFGTNEVNESQLKLFIERNGTDTIKSITGDSYGRYLSLDMVKLLVEGSSFGWRTPPARARNVQGERTRIATEDDVLNNLSSVGGLEVKVGDLICPSGVYHSDRNTFIFQVRDDEPIEVNGKLLHRGYFASNSEVGESRAAELTSFYYSAICGNHYVHGAEGVRTVRRIHRKNAILKFKDEGMKFMEHLGTSPLADQRSFSVASKAILGPNRDTIVSALYKDKPQNTNAVTKKVLESAYDQAEQWSHVSYGEPNSALWYVDGLTRLSQSACNADVRQKIDEMGGWILSHYSPEDASLTVAPAIVVAEDGSITTDATVTQGRKSRKK